MCASGQTMGIQVSRDLSKIMMQEKKSSCAHCFEGRMDCPLRILALLFLEGSGIPEEQREREGFREERKNPHDSDFLKSLSKG